MSSSSLTRRQALRAMIGYGAAGLSANTLFAKPANSPSTDRANIILAMADDLGWGDTGYNGHPVLKTPTLDEMSRAGVRFDRYYASAPVCSPTRGACLTGRHPYRYGIKFANTGHMREEEMTLAEALKPLGYRTGHFGKWHLGTLTKKIKESNRGGPRGVEHYAPPWDNGFDVCFSTEAKTPTYDPMVIPEGEKNAGKPYGTHYWSGPEQMVTENLKGDDSRIIMDRAIPFIRESVKSKEPFFTVIWFHAPHLPTVAGEKHLRLYPDVEMSTRHYYGCITALDEQMGRLRKELQALGAADNTMLWFMSDNGPEGKSGPGSAGDFRGRKRSLYEGGIRVPALLEWPERISKPRNIQAPCCGSDYFPTIMTALKSAPQQRPRPVDGINIWDIIDGKTDQRSHPIGFQSRNQIALIDDRYKVYSGDQGKTFELYDLVEDPSEKNDLASGKPDMTEKMKRLVMKWRESCEESAEGADYRKKE